MTCLSWRLSFGRGGPHRRGPLRSAAHARAGARSDGLGLKDCSAMKPSLRVIPIAIGTNEAIPQRLDFTKKGLLRSPTHSRPCARSDGLGMKDCSAMKPSLRVIPKAINTKDTIPQRLKFRSEE